MAYTTKKMESLFFLGRQPELGLAELESLYGAAAISPLSSMIAGSTLAAEVIDFSRIGGSSKLATVLAKGSDTNWRNIEKVLLQVAADAAENLTEGKINFGLSVYDLPVDVKDVIASSLRIKKAIRAKTGQNVRVVPNQSPALSSAQIVNNSLTNERGLELVVAQAGGAVYIAKTHREQDINAYAKRDQNRPKRDARVGMLPPKLAQILVNLAVGPLANGRWLMEDGDHSKKPIANSHIPATVLDPFCGTGVLLQEAALMGYNVYGTDIEQRMIDYSQTNLLWLNETHKLQKIEATLEAGDATNYTWNEPFTAVAAEGYLGQPFTGFPTPEKLNTVTNTCNLIAKEFLKNIGKQIPSGTRIAIGLPAWQKPNGQFVHLKMLDSLEDLGYNRVSFVHSDAENLLYYRPDQIVARELLVITRK